MIAEGAGFRQLLERLVEKYETQEGLADHLHIEMFTQLPEVLRRARRVRPLVLGQEVPPGLSRRYREAVESYLAGHAIACCVLLRAVLETALKDAFERHTLALNDALEALTATQQILKCIFQGTIGSPRSRAE